MQTLHFCQAHDSHRTQVEWWAAKEWHTPQKRVKQCGGLKTLKTQRSAESLDNPGSAGSGTNDFFQTPEESKGVREVVHGKRDNM
ncbi:unnamed protein product [Lota lota]